jgi:peptidoglycan-associated lipoprotein
MKKQSWIGLILTATLLMGCGLASCTKKYHVVGPESSGSTIPDQEKKKTSGEGTEAIAQKVQVEKQDTLKQESYKIRDLPPEDETRPMSSETIRKAEIDAFEASPVYFDYDESDLKSEAMENLSKKAAWLETNQEYTILIEGHCDERGTHEYNLALGDRRAEAVKKYLTALGISERRIETISYGEEKPAAPGDDEQAWAKNRRAEFRVIR